MSELYIDVEDVASDFLRVYLTDPRSRAEASTTQTNTSTSSQTTLTLVDPTGYTISCVTALTVDGTAYTKWKDYHWDYQNNKITFFTALSAGLEIISTFKYGTKNWIYSDMPDENLDSNSWPRIDVFTISSPGVKLGNYEAPVIGTMFLQIDIWAKENYVATIGGRDYHGIYLTRYLGNQISKAFEDNEGSLHPLLFNYVPVSLPRTAPFSEQYLAYHTIVEISIQGISPGRIVY